jgi:hypothetical protein
VVPRRSPPDWNDNLADGEVAVFLSDVRSDAELTADGLPRPVQKPSVCLVFKSRSAADEWCQRRVGEIEHLKCELYDRRGMAGGPIASFVNAKYAARLPNRRTAVKMILWAVACFAVSPVLFWLDWRVRGVMILPTLVGFTLVVTGLRLLYWGFSELQLAKEREQQATNQNSRK